MVRIADYQVCSPFAAAAAATPVLAVVASAARRRRLPRHCRRGVCRRLCARSPVALALHPLERFHLVGSMYNM